MSLQCYATHCNRLVNKKRGLSDTATRLGRPPVARDRNAVYIVTVSSLALPGQRGTRGRPVGRSRGGRVRSPFDSSSVPSSVPSSVQYLRPRRQRDRAYLTLCRVRNHPVPPAITPPLPPHLSSGSGCPPMIGGWTPWWCIGVSPKSGIRPGAIWS